MYIDMEKIFRDILLLSWGKKNEINILWYPCDGKYSAPWGNLE